MEGPTTPTPKPKSSIWRKVGLIILIALILGGLFWQNWSLGTMLDHQVQVNMELQQERSNKTAEAERLTKQLQLYVPHEQLVKTVAARDAASDTLMSWLGKRALLKHDSTVVIVNGVFFGGSRYDHKVWCEITDRNGNVRQINPELIKPI